MRLETSSALIGGLLVVLTMIVCYMVIITFRDPAAGAQCNNTGSDDGQDTFMNRRIYRPACGSQWLWNRRHDCRGHTRGNMPSIEAAPTPNTGCFPHHMLGSAPLHACCSTPACGDVCHI